MNFVCLKNNTLFKLSFWGFIGLLKYALDVFLQYYEVLSNYIVLKCCFLPILSLFSSWTPITPVLYLL